MLASHYFNFKTVHPSWYEILETACQSIPDAYIQDLEKTTWLPGAEKIFNAFSIPLNAVNYILFGESPYPRASSANGYAFWDDAVDTLWSTVGLHKTVNRATSLRNFIKMLLVSDGALSIHQTTPEQIAGLDKTNYIQTNHQLFNNLINHGFLLLNATLVLRKDYVRQDAKIWQNFIKSILQAILQHNPDCTLILFGKIANAILPLLAHSEHFKKTLIAEHPYNLTFISNPEVLAFFRPFHLLRLPGTAKKVKL